jgi:uncharacterized protein involved in response to NO
MAQDVGGFIPLSSGKRAALGGPTILAYGFRVFFLLGAVWSVAMVAVWAVVYSRGGSVPVGFTPITWHGREMLFGYTGAILAAFLLTAPGFWTGARMPSGHKLGGFAALWMAGRLLPYAHGVLPVALIAAVDAAFFAALAAFLFRLFWRFRLWGNMALPALLAMMSAANAWSYTGRMHITAVTFGTEAMLYLVLMVIALIGGRVIPGFTRTRYPKGSTRDWRFLNQGAIALLAIAALSDLAAWPRGIAAACFAAAAAAHAARLYGWFTREIVREPFLWILYLAYAWLALGLAMKAAACLALVNPMLARHAFTAGAIGTVTLGMMCRVTLGHTGRPIVPLRGTTVAFVLITTAAALRVLLPLVAPPLYRTAVVASAVCWVAAFGMYLVLYAPILIRPRADGQPG